MCERIMVASNGGTNQLTIGGQPIPHEYDDARVLTRQLSAALRDALGTHEVVSESAGAPSNARDAPIQNE